MNIFLKKKIQKTSGNKRIINKRIVAIIIVIIELKVWEELLCFKIIFNWEFCPSTSTNFLLFLIEFSFKSILCTYYLFFQNDIFYQYYYEFNFTEGTKKAIEEIAFTADRPYTQQFSVWLRSTLANIPNGFYKFSSDIWYQMSANLFVKYLIFYTVNTFKSRFFKYIYGIKKF